MIILRSRVSSCLGDLSESTRGYRVPKPCWTGWKVGVDGSLLQKTGVLQDGPLQY